MRGADVQCAVVLKLAKSAARAHERGKVRGTSNVVAPLSSFVGREADLEVIEQAFAGGARIVTVLGPGGMGKTRLLYRFAECKSARFSACGGVWFVDLTMARDAFDLCGATARALGLRLTPELDEDARIAFVARVLSEMSAVLLLCDNFEQLGSDATEAVATWCAAAPELAVLVSSRRRLSIAGETVLALEPLETPPAGADDEGCLEASDAARLFVDRALAAGHRIDASERRAVVALVRELEGIPLAIELAAARSRIASPRESLERLERGRDIVGKRSMQSAIARSWELLSDWEASAIAQCAFFAGDFTLDAAEAVLDVSAFADAPPVLDIIASLRDQSLLAKREVDGTTRFHMYASLREFAGEQLDGTDRPGVEARHRRHFSQAAVRVAETLWKTGDVKQWRSLDAYRDDVLVIFRAMRSASSRSREDLLALAEIVWCMEPSIATTGSIEELLAMLDVGVEAAVTAGDPSGEEQARARVLAARLLVARASAYGIRGDSARALADLSHAEALAEALGDDALLAEALTLASLRVRQQGTVSEAIAMVGRAATLAGTDRWPRIEGACSVVRGLLLGEAGRAEDARRANLRARAIFVEAGDTWSEALALANVAQLDQAAGDFEAAERGFDAAIAIFRSFGDRRYEGRYLGYRAALDHERGDIDAAIAGYRRAIVRGVRLAHTDALWHACLGAALATTRDLHAARAELELAEGMLARVDAPMFAAALALHRGHLDHACAPPLLAAAAYVDRSEDVRFAARLLERALAGSATSPLALTVGPAARSFQLGSEPVVDLSRRGSLHRILDWLVTRRVEAPGVSSDWQVLLEHGWPNERVMVEAGATRVRVAVATLRKLGLARVLVTRDDGYLLSEHVVVRRVNA